MCKYVFFFWSCKCAVATNSPNATARVGVPRCATSGCQRPSDAKTLNGSKIRLKTWVALNCMVKYVCGQTFQDVYK